MARFRQRTPSIFTACFQRSLSSSLYLILLSTTTSEADGDGGGIGGTFPHRLRWAYPALSTKAPISPNHHPPRIFTCSPTWYLIIQVLTNLLTACKDRSPDADTSELVVIIGSTSKRYTHGILSLPTENDSACDYPFIGKTPQQWCDMLKEVAGTNKHVMPESLVILDERAIADQTVLLVNLGEERSIVRVVFRGGVLVDGLSSHGAHGYGGVCAHSGAERGRGVGV